MITWLKNIGSALAAAALAFLAFRAVNEVTGYKKSAEKWRKKHDEHLTSGRDDALKLAAAAKNVANAQEARAKSAKEKAEKRIDELAKRDESVADIVDRWRKQIR